MIVTIAKIVTAEMHWFWSEMAILMKWDELKLITHQDKHQDIFIFGSSHIALDKQYKKQEQIKILKKESAMKDK